MDEYFANKYGKTSHYITKDTGGEIAIEKALKHIKADYIKQFKFDETGIRSISFDFAVKDKDGNLALLIEYDGGPHTSLKWWTDGKVRAERARPHFIRRQQNDAYKEKLAFEHGLPLLRINSAYSETSIKYVVYAYCWVFVGKKSKEGAEQSMVNMMDQYEAWDFDYVEPSSPGKAEKKFLEERRRAHEADANKD